MVMEVVEFAAFIESVHFTVREQKLIKLNLFVTEAQTSPFLAARFAIVYSSLQQYFHCNITFSHGPAYCTMYVNIRYTAGL